MDRPLSKAPFNKKGKKLRKKVQAQIENIQSDERASTVTYL